MPERDKLCARLRVPWLEGQCPQGAPEGAAAADRGVMRRGRSLGLVFPSVGSGGWSCSAPHLVGPDGWSREGTPRLVGPSEVTSDVLCPVLGSPVQEKR